MEFALVIIVALLCFLLGAMLFKSPVRKVFPTELLSAYFYLEGIWAMVNYIIGSIFPTSHIMDIIKYCYTLLLAVLLLLFLFKTGKRKSKNDKKQRFTDKK